MVLWSFKCCPRCGGDIFIDRELNNWCQHCLQCGYLHDLRNIVDADQQQAWREKMERRVGNLSKGT